MVADAEGNSSRISNHVKFSFLSVILVIYIMARPPSEPPVPEWTANWKDIQPALKKARRSLASVRALPMKVMRVSQLDSEILDGELFQILKDQLWDALSLFKVNIYYFGISVGKQRR